MSVSDYLPEISDFNSSSENSPRSLFEQNKTVMGTFSLNGSSISTHNDSKTLLLIEFKSLNVLFTQGHHSTFQKLLGRFGCLVAVNDLRYPRFCY